MINVDKLKRIKRMKFGESMTYNMSIEKDELAIAFKLCMEGKPIDSKSMLIEQMQSNLPYINPELKPFCKAILEVYKVQC